MRRSARQNIPLIILGGLLFILFLLVLVYLSLGRQEQTKKDPVTEEIVSQQETEVQEKWQEGTITYQGKSYSYNENIHTYLMMGIDKNEPVEAAADYVSGGQSDAMFLLVTDSSTKRISVIAINRNTMVDLTYFDENGLNMGSKTSQICISHGFGDGKKLSCNYAVDAVETLFSNIPIDGYLAMNMGGIPLMNDAVGGVEVTVLHDLSNPSTGVDLKEGDTVRLTGTEAYEYLHGRDCNEFGSADYRLERQQQYISLYMKQLEAYTGGDQDKVLAIYQELEPYIVTNIDYANLLSELMNYSYDSSDMYSIQGQTLANGNYEEFYPDQEALEALIIQVFYQEVSP